MHSVWWVELPEDSIPSAVDVEDSAERVIEGRPHVATRGLALNLSTCFMSPLAAMFSPLSKSIVPDPLPDHPSANLTEITIHMRNHRSSRLNHRINQNLGVNKRRGETSLI
ncbi:hypothetical protein BT69DRAFT_267477 [Atractiella rhizophila]|nr:hypothetical protein BT69DRAFT_267477 [Atractiella rhizophila]